MLQIIPVIESVHARVTRKVHLRTSLLSVAPLVVRF
jgi:hypothetical protein